MSEISKVSLIIEYAGTGGKSGGTYVNSSIKHDAADEHLYAVAYAINELQTDFANKVFKQVETILSE